MIAGIYRIINIINNKCYVGSAVNIDARWRRHKHDLRKSTHGNILLSRAWSKYGKENFIFEIIEELFDKSKLIEREQYYIDTLKPEYNICKIAGSCLGIKHTKEACQNMRLSRLGMKRKPFSKEHKENMRKAHKGVSLSKEHRQKQSDSLMGKSGCQSRAWGKTWKLSKETRTRMKKPKSKEHVANMRRVRIGKPLSEKTKLKMRKPKSNEHKQAMRDAWKTRRNLICQNTNSSARSAKE